MSITVSPPRRRDYPDPHGIWERANAVGIHDIAELARQCGLDNYQHIQRLLKMTDTGRVPASPKYLKIVDDTLKRLEAAQAQIGAARAQLAPAGRPVTVPGFQHPHVNPPGAAVVFPITKCDGEAYCVSETALSFVRIPEPLDAVDGVFAVVMRDPAMAPMYRPGDVLVLNPLGVPQLGGGVAVVSDHGKITVREFIEADDGAMKVRRYGRTPGVEDAPQGAVYTVAAVYPAR